MKAYRYTNVSGVSAITLVEASMPEPGPGEVRIRVQAASVNYRDLLILAAAGRGEVKDRIPLSDGAGVIEAVGSGARRWPVGLRVMMSHFRDWTTGPFRAAYVSSGLGGIATDGVLAEYVVLPETAVVAIPESLSFAEAACLPCAAVTAWNGLVVRAGLKAGDTLLVQGKGGVALFGLQIAVAMGAEVIVLSSSDDKLAKAKAMGASVLINYRERPDWDVAVMEGTAGRGASHILELGGPDTYDRSVRSVAAGGTIVQVGVLSGFDPAPHLRRLMWENANIMGVTVGSADHLATVAAFIATNALHPVIDTTFRFDEAPCALERLRSGAHFGKVVIGQASELQPVKGS
jgi:NADPH:quinone reductase-like Zn-dependent oxidoreductase